MRNKPAFIFGLVLMILALIATGLALFAVPVCQTEHAMKCFWMVRAFAMTSFVIAILGACIQFSSRTVAIGLLMGVLGLCFLLIGFATFIIGPCPSPMMHCHAVGQPILVASSVVLSLVSVYKLWRLAVLKD